MKHIFFYNQSFRSTTLNFGPQHPAAHGVLRVVIVVTGEEIIRIDPHIGLLHRGTEKLIEQKSFIQALPYFDRLDYVSMMSNELMFSLAVEKFIEVELPMRAQCIRIIFVELTRILNHLMALTTHALDIGALTPFLWAFEEREKIMEFYERVSGARMHANYIRPGGVSYDIPYGLLNDIFNFTLGFSSRCDEAEELLTENRIWKQRLINIGIISSKQALEWSMSGAILRSTGMGWDLRLSFPYEIYRNILFGVPVGINGDSYDRYILRMEEMRQAAFIVNQVINTLPDGLTKFESKFTNPGREFLKLDMELVINHFKYFNNSVVVNSGCNYTSVEAPKGENGIFLVFTGDTEKINRCKIRSPGFFHLQTLTWLALKHLLADLVTLIGTLDLVLGEIDK